MEDRDVLAIKQCQRGNLEAFGGLYDAYIKKIYDFVYFKTNHKETAEDIVSQVFFKALSKIGKFKFSQGTFQAWLYQIARNTVIDFYRTKKQDANVDDYWGLKDKTDIARDTEVKLKLEEVDVYLTKLKPEQREIIIMRVWQGMSYQEIAAVMVKSEASCKMVFSRAVRKLRDEIPLVVLIHLIMYS